MNNHGQSDSDVVPMKSPNKAGKPVAEVMEGRSLTEGNELQANTRRTQGWESVNSKLQLIRRNAKANKEMKFTALMHHIYNRETLRAAYWSIKPDAAPGIDGVKWEDFGLELEHNLNELSKRLKQGVYRAKPVRRVFIPKPDGTKRPLGVTALEDKIVQRATVEVLNAIYEMDFKGFSYGFRPGRSQHQALDAIYVAIKTKRVNWVVDADIRDFFGSIGFENLVKFVERRVADRRVIRLIQKWLKAGVLEDGQIEYTEEGTPQGASASPLLANVYLHYVYDEWIQWWRKTQSRGEVIVVRFADDTIVGFQHQDDAERFLNELKEQFQKFGLELHPEKTRLIEFGRIASERRKRLGQGKPKTFNFLGFTHICGLTRRGKFAIKRKTIGKKMRGKLFDLKEQLRQRMHRSVKENGEWLNKVVSGHYQYYGVPGNYESLSNFRYQVAIAWFAALKRRSQRHKITWERMSSYIKRWLPSPHIYHPYPDARFGRPTQGKSRVR
jgi:group II intron reverse transcriptase/maturase